MRRVYITFSGAAYNATTARIVENAPKMGADEVWVYDDKWLLETDFYHLNRWLWEHHGDMHNHPRGFGWFCWKPFIMLDAFSRLQDGDIVLFTDADTYPVADLSVLYEECARNGGAMLFSAVGHHNRQWVKRDCFLVMGQDCAEYHDGQHATARFMLIQRGPWKPYQFLLEWQTYCLNPYAQTFDPSVLAPELEGFREHRTEQAIMTLLGLKYGFTFYREACQFGDGCDDDRELFPTLFHQEYCSAPKTLEGSLFRNVDHSGIGG